MVDRAKRTAKAPQSRTGTRAAHTRRSRAVQATSSVNRVLALQRTVGNQAVERLLTADLSTAPLRIQREPTNEEVFLRFDVVKKHLKAKYPDLHKLVADNPFNGTFADARTETIDGTKHTWQIAVSFEFLGLGSNGKTGPAKSPPGKPNVHRINVLVNTFAFDDDALKKLFPKTRDRLEYQRAQTMAHELIHASVLMQDQGALRTEEAGVIVGYKKMREAARSSGTQKERLQVQTSLSLLLLYLELFEKDEDQRDQFIERELDVLVEEKYANQTSKAGFDLPQIDNDLVARLYVDALAVKLRIKAKQKELSENANRTRFDLRDATKKFYDKIDSELAASAQPVAREAPQRTEPTPAESPRTEPRRRVFGPEP